MDTQGENIVFTESEWRIADLPEYIPVESALTTADELLKRADSCAQQSEELSMSPLLNDKAEGAGLFRKALCLRRMGVELAGRGAAATMGDTVEDFLGDLGSSD